MIISIRHETRDDYRTVEELTREAFWNLYVQGCDEHYLVHVLRNHPDFIPELDLVAVGKDRIIGNIMYARSYIIDESGSRMDTLTFGPVSVLPLYQRQGVGSALIRHSIRIAEECNHTAIIIEGHPRTYCKHGFRSARDLEVSDSEGKYPFGLLVRELVPGILGGHRWKYYPSKVYELDKTDSDLFDKQFELKKKEHRYTQDEFAIACRAYLL